MANNMGRQFSLTLAKEVYKLFLQAAIGGTGAPTLTTTAGASKGIKSITRTSAGIYVITLGRPSYAVVDTYYKLLNIAASFDTSGISGVASTVCSVTLAGNTVSSTGTLTIKCFDYAGSVIDPASGEILRLEISVNNSSAT